MKIELRPRSRLQESDGMKTQHEILMGDPGVRTPLFVKAPLAEAAEPIAKLMADRSHYSTAQTG
jgi:hypothetical protein